VPLRSLRDRIVRWARQKSPWIVHFNSGACNACDIETVAALTPRFDVERFGVQLKGSPRHADVLVCTGPVTRQMKDRLVRIYEQMPEPKLVVAVGTCACSGGVFQGCYCVEGGVDAAIPVSAYVPGCAARPEAIIDGVVKLLGSLDPPRGAVRPPEVRAAEEVEAVEEEEEVEHG
jgi:NADH-quinone oxidoreductase B subunit